ncbi:MAG: methionine biosynthesis protein MetW, partial [Bryobacteraceae bacterium]
MDDDALTAAIREIRERVRARHPQGANGSGADLMPLIHARDAAQAKVASIGTVNPRRSGWKNDVIQRVKKMVARSLAWHVREQVEFNRAAMDCVQAALEALSDQARGIVELAAKVKTLEERLEAGEIRALRAISEVHGAIGHSATEVQKRMWRDLEKIRGEYETLIHSELKLIRQKLTAQSAAAGIAAAAPAQSIASHPIAIDWLRFAENFRGPEEQIIEGQKRHAARFAGTKDVLDLGCGRGEFLDVAREAGIDARGIDQSIECV